MAYKISDKCIACGTCASACPMQCINKKDDSDKYQINKEQCIDCGTCASVCPVGAPEAE